jgi:hypothetical protein
MNASASRNIAGSLALATIIAIGTTAMWILLLMTLTVFSQSDPLFRALDNQLPFGLIVWILLLSSPTMITIELMLLLPLSLVKVRFPDFGSALEGGFPAHSIPVLLSIVFSAPCALLCYRRHRRYSEREAVEWTFFVFLMGLPGLIGYLLHRRWPATEYCVNCRKNSPRDRDACLHCGTPFPTPAPKGIEIFA